MVRKTFAQALALAWAATVASGAPTALLDRAGSRQGIRPSFDVASCPGYRLVGQPHDAASGFTASLALAGDACNAFGVDIKNLTLAVVYEKPEQLHVHIYDTAKQQYQLPNGLLFDRPSDDPAQAGMSTAADSHLEFHHTGSKAPWAFWVTRKSTGDVLFDTRPERIPTYEDGLNETETKHNSTAMPAHPLIFENQYLQLSSALPDDAHIYGLGEYISGGFRRNPNATLQPFFTLDAGNPVDSNEYGYFPMYLEVRQNGTSSVASHAVYHQNTAGLDVLLRPKVIQYRAIGGTLDFRFFSGDESAASSSSSKNETQSARNDVSQQAERSLLQLRDDTTNASTTDVAASGAADNTPLTAIAQFVSFIGKPLMVPRWAFGFHLCRWGYRTANATLAVAKKMREHDIPLETMWNDIDILDSFRDLTIAPGRFDQGDVNRLIDYLRQHQQHYIPIVDAAIPAAPTNASDRYDLGTVGREQDVFLKNANGTTYVGQVWPGFTYFPDWLSDNAQTWWNQGFKNFSELVDFSGIWLDMNEPSSFCVGSCGSGANLSQWFGHEVPTSVAGWPEGYDNNTFGNSGNITVRGKSTYSPTRTHGHDKRARESRRPLQTYLSNKAASAEQNGNHYTLPDWEYMNETQRYLTVPPYKIANGIHNSDSNLVDNLNQKTVAMEALSANTSFYDVHNIYGSLFEKATYEALKALRPKERPFLVARSTYPGVGQYSHHWLGDNYSLWSYLWRNMQGLLQFQMFGINFIGADTCGFARNSNEDLCNRWQMFSAMLAPFYRNHNVEVAISQEPYVWDSVAHATRKANYKRLELLPYYYTVMARASQRGVPAVRTLWQEFPKTFADTGATESQALFGPSLLVTPVFEPNASSVKGYFPSAGGKWRSVFDYRALEVPENKNVSIPAPLSTINAHVRPGSVLLTYAQPRYTTNETASGPYGLLVNLDDSHSARGDAYVDDGLTAPPCPYRELTFQASNGSLTGRAVEGDFTVGQKLSHVVLLGLSERPEKVQLAGGRGAQDRGAQAKEFVFDHDRQMLNVTDIGADLNGDWTLTWA
ncbi:unnamed protein product [Parajaminaea phylloscopi]